MSISIYDPRASGSTKPDYEMTHYVPITSIIINSDNGMSPVQHQVIAWTDASLLLIGPGNKFKWNLNQNTPMFIKKWISKCHLKNDAQFVSAKAR